MIRKVICTIDARGWIGISVFVLVCIILAMIGLSESLRQDEFFKTIATLLVGAFIKDVVGWAYTATKQGGELAERNQSMVEQSMPAAGQPQRVIVDNPPSEPVPTTDAPTDVLPEYAR